MASFPTAPVSQTLNNYRPDLYKTMYHKGEEEMDKLVRLWDAHPELH